MAEVEVGEARPWLIYVVVALTVVAVVGGYIALAAVHSEGLRVVRDGATVRVERGLYAPFGWDTYRPTEAFKPVTIDADVPVRAGDCADLADCESRLFDVVAAQARRLLARRENMREAGELIAQAVKLSGAQNRELMLELQGDEQYVKGLSKLEAVSDLLTEAQDHFYRARAMDARSFRDAEQRLKMVSAMLQELERAGVGRPGVGDGLPVPYRPTPRGAAPRVDIAPPERGAGAAPAEPQAPPSTPVPRQDADAGAPDGGMEL